MTSRAPQWFERKYINGAIHVTQDEGYRLKGAVNETGEIKGNEVVWKLAGKGEATEMSDAIEELPVMNADRSTLNAFMKDYQANEWIKSTDIEKMSENEQQVAQQTAGYAIGRLCDRLPMRAMDAAAGAITTLDVSAASAPSVVDAITAVAQIQAQGYTARPAFYCGLPAMVMAQLELYKEFSSSDWIGDQRPMLKEIGARSYRGVHFIPLPDELFTIVTPAAPPAPAVIDMYLWQKTALGVVPNYALVSRIDYVPTRGQYFAHNRIGIAHKVLLPEGIRRIRTKLPLQLIRPA